MVKFEFYVLLTVGITFNSVTFAAFTDAHGPNDSTHVKYFHFRLTNRVVKLKHHLTAITSSAQSLLTAVATSGSFSISSTKNNKQGSGK